MGTRPAIGSDNSAGLSQSNLIGELTSANLARFGKLAKRVELENGSVLFFQDDSGDAMYVIESGSIEISVLSAQGKKLSLNVMRAPDVLGEIAALDGGARTATATAIETTKLLRFDRTEVLQAILDSPQLASELIAVLCARLRWVSQQVEDLALLNIEGRLANRLLILHRKFSDEHGCVPLSQSELADFLGATRESINKILQVWRAKGFIELSRGAVRVCDQKGLAAVADMN